MSHYFNNGYRTPAMDAAYLNPPGSGERQRRPAGKGNVGPTGSSEHLRMAVEILTMPGGPSRDLIRVAIAALQFHLERSVEPEPRVTESEIAKQARQLRRLRGNTGPHFYGGEKA